MGAGGGKVGVGTLYPREKLDIAGSVRASGKITTDASILLGTMSTSSKSPSKGEIRYVEDDFVGYTKDRGWQSLTATIQSSANGTNGFLSYFVGPTGQSWASGLGWSEISKEFRLQSKYSRDPPTSLVLKAGVTITGMPKALFEQVNKDLPPNDEFRIFTHRKYSRGASASPKIALLGTIWLMCRLGTLS